MSTGSWFDGIRRAVADTAGPDAAARFQRAAEQAYDLYSQVGGEAWGQHAVRQVVKTALATAAHAAGQEAGKPRKGYEEAADEVQQAWAELDAAFVTAHRDELEAGWPEGFAAAFGCLGAGTSHDAAPADFGLIWTATAGFPASARPQPSRRANREAARYARQSRPGDPAAGRDAVRLAAASFPGAVQAWPAGEPGLREPAAPRRRAARTDSAGQQARPGRSR